MSTVAFHHRFRVHAPLAAVTAFHRQPASLAAITPPPVLVRIQSAPAELDEGDDMAFTLWLGPLPIRWLARIENVTANGFLDRQLSGPFRHWLHRHTFVTLNPAITEVYDTISAELRDEPQWRLLGQAMWYSLPILFTLRARKTRRLLEHR